MKRRYMTLAVALVGTGLALCIGAVATRQLAGNESDVSIEQVPPSVRAALLAQAQGGAIKEIEMENENGQAVYEAEVTIDGKEVEVKVAADGTLLGKEADDGDEGDDADDEEEDEGEEQMSFAEVPGAVQTTIENAAAGAEIKEIEKENEDGRDVYSADMILDGHEVEIKVAPDGTLLGKEVDDEDNDE